MINKELLYKIIGQLIFLEAMLMGCCFVIAFFFHEDDTLAFLESTIISIFAGVVLKLFGHCLS